MKSVRLIGLLFVLVVIGCSRSGENRSPQKMIIGRWEGAEGGIEFTTAGSAFVLPKKELGQYRFVDDQTMEVTVSGQSGRLTGVAVSIDELSFTADGKTMKLRRVKDFSAALLARDNAKPVHAPSPPTNDQKVSKPLHAQQSDESEPGVESESQVKKHQPEVPVRPRPELKLDKPSMPTDPQPTPPKILDKK